MVYKGNNGMFRANENHKQQYLFDSTYPMDSGIRNKLEKSWAPVFYEHVFLRIDEEPFAVLYGDTGRPNFPINILLSLEYIKHMRNCNDLELLDAFYFDYLVNYAVGNRTLGEINLAERTLYYFRERVYKYCIENPGSDDIMFGQFVKLFREFSAKAGIALEEQRTDTTLFMSNIKKAGRISLAYDVLVKTVKAIPEDKLTEALADVLKPDFKTDTLYRAKAEEGERRLTVILNLCKEALLILELLPGATDSSAVRIAKRFLDEQALMEGEPGKLTPKPKKEISSGSLQSAYDEGATFRRKEHVAQSGYVLEISETCGKGNDFQMITDYTVRPNNVSDVEILGGRLNTIRENTGCTDMYTDGGFHSEDIHKTAEENGIEIHLTAMSGTAPTKKMSAAEFDIDENTNRISQCPGGQAPTRTGMSRGQTSAHFPHEACAGCELKERCYSKKQSKDCVVRIPVKTVKAARDREKIKTDKKENTSMRAAIEGTNSALKSKGQKKLKVRGIEKSTIVSSLKVTAQNIKRFIKYSQGGYEQKKSGAPVNGIVAPILS
jgi:hypothetical protein